jgi:hypothetical protein
MYLQMTLTAYFLIIDISSHAYFLLFAHCTLIKLIKNTMHIGKKNESIYDVPFYESLVLTTY